MDNNDFLLKAKLLILLSFLSLITKGQLAQIDSFRQIETKNIYIKNFNHKLTHQQVLVSSKPEFDSIIGKKGDFSFDFENYNLLITTFVDGRVNCSKITSLKIFNDTAVVTHHDFEYTLLKKFYTEAYKISKQIKLKGYSYNIKYYKNFTPIMSDSLCEVIKLMD